MPPITTVEERLTELRDERGRYLTEMTEIHDTAKEADRDLTDEEFARYEELKGLVEEKDSEIDTAEQDAAKARAVDDHDDFVNRHLPAVNTLTDPPESATRSLDELFWATDEEVTAGSFDRNGRFFRSPTGARNAVEQTVVESRSGDHVDAPRMGEFRPDDQAKVRQFQRTVGDMILFGLLIDRTAKNSTDGFRAALTDSGMKARYQRALRALDVDTSGEGADWVPTGIGGSIHEKVRAAGKVAPLFTRINIPTNPWKWPIEGSDAAAYRVAEPTGDSESKFTASTPGTAGATFDAEIFGARSLWSRSVDRDSALAILPFVAGKLAQAHVDAEETAILNGDSDGTHQDSDIGASTTAPETAWDGLRKRALANAGSDAGNVAVTLALLRGARKLMGKWGLNPAELAIVASVGAYYDLLDLGEVTTVDKMGAQATVLNGMLGAVDGIPVIVSEHMREDLNASGVYDGTTTDRTALVVVNRGEFAIGQREALDVEIDDSIYRETYQRVAVTFRREDFQNIGDASSNDDVAILYNLA